MGASLDAKLTLLVFYICFAAVRHMLATLWLQKAFPAHLESQVQTVTL